MTSCGLNGGPLRGLGRYSTCIACNVYGKGGTRFLSMIKRPKGRGPFLTQAGKDREEGPEQYVSNFCTGCTVGFKYFDLRETKKIRVSLQGYGECLVTVRTRTDAKPVCYIPVVTCKQERAFVGELKGAFGEREALYFSVEGKGTFDFLSFELA